MGFNISNMTDKIWIYLNNKKEIIKFFKVLNAHFHKYIFLQIIHYLRCYGFLAKF